MCKTKSSWRFITLWCRKLKKNKCIGRSSGGKTYWAHRINVKAFLELKVVYQKLHWPELDSITTTSEVCIDNQFSFQQMLKSLQRSTTPSSTKESYATQKYNINITWMLEGAWWVLSIRIRTLPVTQFHESNDHLFYDFLAGAGILSHPYQFESLGPLIKLNNKHQ
jgi:hypothetical protein